MNTNPRCITCKFFEQKDDRQGICHRYPPTVFILGAGKSATVPTFVEVQGWCVPIIHGVQFSKFNVPKKESPPQ